MRYRFHLFLLMMTLLFLMGCSTKEQERPEIVVFAAASLTDVVQEIGLLFETNFDCDVQYNFAGTGTLARQITHSSYGDVFLSANPYWMEFVDQSGRLKPGSVVPFLSNSLVLICSKNSTFQLEDPTQISNLPFRFLAIGDPNSVPAGKYSQQWLQSIELSNQISLWDALQNRISPTQDVRSALMQAQANSDVIGIVYRTDYNARKDNIRLLYQIPPSSGPKISYTSGLINSSSHPELAQSFQRFLGSSVATAVFEKHGFAIHSSPN